MSNNRYMLIRTQRFEKKGESEAERTVDERPCENGDNVRKREANFRDIESVRRPNVNLDGPSVSNDAICIDDGQRNMS